MDFLYQCSQDRAMLSSSTSVKLCTFRGKGNRVVIWKGRTTWQDNSRNFLKVAILSKGKIALDVWFP
jgi:hypothetical protein